LSEVRLSEATVTDTAFIPQNRPRILVVEDEMLVRMMLAEELRDCGFDVVEAVNAEEAIATLQNGRPIDLVLTDMQMPGRIDGLELVWQISRLHPDLKVIILSARQMDKPMAANVAAWFRKPFDVGRILERVREIL
jgi:CheY-like chemotaxis protein